MKRIVFLSIILFNTLSFVFISCEKENDDENNSRISSWTAIQSLKGKSVAHSSVIHNDFLYIIGGSDGSNTYDLKSLYYCSINSGGTLGNWVDGPNLSEQRSNLSALVNNDFLYVIGGFGGPLSNYIEYALIDPDGSIGNWQTTKAYDIDRLAHETVIYNQYIYVLGGLDKSFNSLSNVQYSKINSDGSLGDWNSTTSIDFEIHDFTCIAYKGYLYSIGGNTDNNNEIDNVQYAAISSDGSLGEWSDLNPLPVPLTAHTAFCKDGYVYVLGGYNNSIYYAKINTDGTISKWEKDLNSFMTARGNHSSNVNNDIIYIIGGSGNGGEVLSDIQKASFVK